MSERTVDTVDQLGGGAHFVAYAKRGGPIAAGSGATSAAITFSTPFPDTDYQVAIEWVSGSTPGTGIRDKTSSYAYAVFAQVTTDSAFNWKAWRL